MRTFPASAYIIKRGEIYVVFVALETVLYGLGDCQEEGADQRLFGDARPENRAYWLLCNRSASEHLLNVGPFKTQQSQTSELRHNCLRI